MPVDLARKGSTGAVNMKHTRIEWQRDLLHCDDLCFSVGVSGASRSSPGEGFRMAQGYVIRVIMLFMYSPDATVSCEDMTLP